VWSQHDVPILVFESMVLVVCGENKKCKGEVCNIGLVADNDVHVHQPKKNH
jgi:hypothetical protein